MSLLAAQAARQRAISTRHHQHVTVVIGPPCSGKTTHVVEHASPDDIIVDFDAIALALGSKSTHDHSAALLAVTAAARDAALSAALGTRTKVWVILTHKRQIAQYGLTGAVVHVIDTPLDECGTRALAQGRSQRVLDVIRTWSQVNT